MIIATTATTLHNSHTTRLSYFLGAVLCLFYFHKNFRYHPLKFQAVDNLQPNVVKKVMNEKELSIKPSKQKNDIKFVDPTGSEMEEKIP